MELKTFQRTALDTLRTYLDRARVIGDPEQAFIQTLRQRDPDRNPPPYRTISGTSRRPERLFSLTYGRRKNFACRVHHCRGRAFLS